MADKDSIEPPSFTGPKLLEDLQKICITIVRPFTTMG